MLRLRFEKKGQAVWISHLDLMRLFQRAFQRAGLHLTHTQGYNPRPSVSIALPLSVGTESCCELLDFDLQGERPSYAVICQKLNDALVGGIRVLEVYENGGKIKDLAYLDCTVTLHYDAGCAKVAANEVRDLFRRDSLLVSKKSKNGVTQQDIIPMIRSISVNAPDAEHLMLNARICCQNPSLNPAQLGAAVETWLPQWKPDHIRCTRNEIYDKNNKPFR